MSWVEHSVPDRDERTSAAAELRALRRTVFQNEGGGSTEQLGRKSAAPVSSIWIKQPAQWFAEMRRVVDLK